MGLCSFLTMTDNILLEFVWYKIQISDLAVNRISGELCFLSDEL